MVKRAIIPAAGYGTRGLPITKVIPKEMFPIGMKPAIQFIIEEAIEAGIEHILVIVSRSKSIIIDYFDESLELETFLEKSNKQHLKGKLNIPKVQLHYTRQPKAKGLGDAIRLGEAFIGNEPFAVLLPDDIILPKKKGAIRELIELYKEKQSSVIGLKEVEEKELHQYGVIGGQKMEEGVYEVHDIIEKPKNHPPSNLAVVGRYVFTPEIFSFLKNLKAGHGEEIQLTDAIKKLLDQEPCYGKCITGDRFDIGKTKDYIDIVMKMNKE